jgi:hypothetical protein
MMRGDRQRQTRALRLSGSVLTLALLGACGGGDSSSNPPPSNPPPTAPSDPCAAASSTAGEDAPSESRATAESPKVRPRLDGDPRWSVLNSLWLHSASAARGLRTATATDRDAADVGEIAVIQDVGDVVVAASPFDLPSLNLRFTSNGTGYDIARITTGFRSPLGTRLTLNDDDASEFTIPFAFSFFGTGQTRAFVNSDGNITFGESDIASSDRSVSRFLTGPPRVAPFFADLDPSTGSGRVFLQAAADGTTVTWCSVRGFEATQTVTVQAVLLPDGAIEMHFGSGIGLKSAVVGVSPGRTGQFQPVDLSATGPLSGGANAVGERFSAEPDIDLVTLSRRFYQTHADNFDQLVIFTNTKVVAGNTFAFESTVANEIRGLGIDTFDSSRDFGSGGRLRSLVMMDTLTKYPASPTTRFLGENNTLSVMGQEVGHRWLAFLRFRDVNNQTSTALLGRDQAHWGFFMDTDASVMEGNDIEDLGGGAFKTVDAVKRYSLLDQYAMGLVRESQVPDFFYVESPVNVQPSRDAEDDPDIGVTFNGTRRVVRIEDVTAAMGQRSPTSGNSPRVIRQAFIYVVAGGAAADAAQIGKLDGIRRAWVDFFNAATSKRMKAQTTLN